MQTTTQSLQTWRRLILFGAAFVLAAVFPSTLRATVRWETLEAIHRIENPFDSERPGPCGELGAYQFRERTWRMHTTLPFARATERRISDAVAICHYEWLKVGLLRAGIEVTPYTIGLAWNGGLTSVVRGTVGPGTRDYAERVHNIAESLRQAQPPQALLADAR